MVMGGSTGMHPSVSLDTTEIYSDNVWRTAAGKLPVALYYSRAIDISNRVLLFGNKTIYARHCKYCQALVPSPVQSS